jgi:hypothetical protein
MGEHVRHDGRTPQDKVHKRALNTTTIVCGRFLHVRGCILSHLGGIRKTERRLNALTNGAGGLGYASVEVTNPMLEYPPPVRLSPQLRPATPSGRTALRRRIHPSDWQWEKRDDYSLERCSWGLKRSRGGDGPELTAAAP